MIITDIPIIGLLIFLVGAGLWVRILYKMGYRNLSLAGLTLLSLSGYGLIVALALIAFMDWPNNGNRKR